MTFFNTLLNSIGLLALPIFSLSYPCLKYLFNILIYDSDSDSLFNILIVKFLFCGLLQLIATPAITLCNASFASIKLILLLAFNLLVYLYDTASYHLIIKHRALIPLGNEKFVKRISGPGLNLDYFFLIDHNIAITILLYKLEQLQLNAYKSQINEKIKKPRDELLNFYANFNKIGLIYDPNNTKYKSFNNTIDKLTENLEIFSKNYKDKHSIYDLKSYPIKMYQEDLDKTIQQGIELCINFVPTKILARMNDYDQKLFWSSKYLEENDWNGLVVNLLEQIFNKNITTPIENVNSNHYHLLPVNIPHSFTKDLFNGKLPETKTKIIETLIPEEKYPLPSFQIVTPCNIETTHFKKNVFVYIPDK